MVALFFSSPATSYFLVVSFHKNTMIIALVAMKTCIPATGIQNHTTTTSSPYSDACSHQRMAMARVDSITAGHVPQNGTMTDR